MAERLEKMRQIGTVYEKKLERDYVSGIGKYDQDT